MHHGNWLRNHLSSERIQGAITIHQCDICTRVSRTSPFLANVIAHSFPSQRNALTKIFLHRKLAVDSLAWKTARHCILYTFRRPRRLFKPRLKMFGRVMRSSSLEYQHCCMVLQGNTKWILSQIRIVHLRKYSCKPSKFTRRQFPISHTAQSKTNETVLCLKTSRKPSKTRIVV